MWSKSFFLLFIFFLFSTIVVADRPTYDFGDDAFKYLPPFPDDFFEIKNLIATQSIMPSHVGENYYQPELIPSWGQDWVTAIYNHTMLKSWYGMAVYPSRFDVSNVDINDSFKISAFVYSQYGVKVYQGVEAYLDFDETKVDAKIASKTLYILAPTYPQFIPDWLQLIEIDITLLDYGTHNVSICERKVSNESYFKILYGENNFITGGSMLGLNSPRATIYVNSVPSPVQSGWFYFFNSTGENNFAYFFNLLLIFLIIALFVIIYVGVHIAKKRKKEAIGK